jgi:hypothetical protein
MPPWLSELLHRCGVAITVLGAAAFPAIYTLDPSLGEHSGFWRTGRWVLFALWATWLFQISWKLAPRPSISIPFYMRRLRSIEERTEQSLDMQRQTFDLISGLMSVLERTSSGVEGLDHLLKINSLQSELGEIVRTSVSAVNPLEPLIPLPRIAIISVFVCNDVVADQRLAHPSSEADLFDERGVSERLQNILPLNAAVAKQATVSLQLSKQQSDRLPIAWRDTRFAIAGPVLGATGNCVGTVAICLPFEPNEISDDEQVIARCRNLSDDVSSVLERMSEELAKWRTGQ